MPEDKITQEGNLHRKSHENRLHHEDRTPHNETHHHLHTSDTILDIKALLVQYQHAVEDLRDNILKYEAGKQEKTSTSRITPP